MATHISSLFIVALVAHAFAVESLHRAHFSGQVEFRATEGVVFYPMPHIEESRSATVVID